MRNHKALFRLANGSNWPIQDNQVTFNELSGISKVPVARTGFLVLPPTYENFVVISIELNNIFRSSICFMDIILNVNLQFFELLSFSILLHIAYLRNKYVFFQMEHYYIFWKLNFISIETIYTFGHFWSS